MFVWSVPAKLEKLSLPHAAELHAAIAPVHAALAKVARSRRSLKGISKAAKNFCRLRSAREVDQRLVVLPASFDWDDVGAWPAVARHYEKDAAGNVSRGRVLVEQGGNNIVFLRR